MLLLTNILLFGLGYAEGVEPPEGPIYDFVTSFFALIGFAYSFMKFIKYVEKKEKERKDQKNKQ